jgi:signal transduction histidine kinase
MNDLLGRLAGPLFRLPRHTIRLRLTLLYGALFLASGAVLLAITYILVARQYTGKFFVVSGGLQGPIFESATGGGVPVPPGSAGAITSQQLTMGADRQSTAALHQLLLQSGEALAIMAVLSIWLGWLVAGRALRPLRTITNAAREISASNLHRRLALEGPDDELKQLGNTFDELLGRLEASFETQRQFVANASHELRTPLTFERALVEVALADPDATADTLRQMGRDVLSVGEQQERLIEALLTLSRSQRGLDRHEPIDLAAVADHAIRTIEHGSVTVDAQLSPARTIGDSRLVERLVANLVTNAIRHNLPEGQATVRTETKGDQALLTVTNTGHVIAPADVARLFEPFQRLDPGRTSNASGTGLGLSIVAAVASAHAAGIQAHPFPGGGLRVEVGFPSDRVESEHHASPDGPAATDTERRPSSRV